MGLKPSKKTTTQQQQHQHQHQQQQPKEEIRVPKLECESKILTNEDLLFLRKEGFVACSDCEEFETWRLLYSTNRNGRSFATLSDLISAEGQTVVVIKDSNENVFGGVCDTFLGPKPKLYGNGDRAAVFQIKPQRQFFLSTAPNCQFLSEDKFGMGGNVEENWFAWCLESDLENGFSCGPVSNFRGSHVLTAENDNQHQRFVLKDLEVWCVANPQEPRTQEIKLLKLRKNKRANKEPTSLLSNQEVKVDKEILKFGGHEFASDSLF